MIYFFSINTITLIMFGIDKLQAIRKKKRVRERSLLLLIIFGGCFGSFLGMITFHHKTKKRKFQLIVSAMIILWSILLYMEMMK